MPVGIMVYSSAYVMGVPVETVIKVFRKNLGSHSFDTLEEYHDAFVVFLTQDDNFFTADMRLAHCLEVIAYTFSQIRRTAFNELIRRFPGLKEPKKQQVRQVALEVLTDFQKHYAGSNDLYGVTQQLRNKVKRDTRPTVQNWEIEFRKQLNLTLTDVRILTEIAIGVVLKEARNHVETGFVIAGFGEKEIFPQLRSVEFETSLYGINKVFSGELADLTKTTAQIVPFAQKEMIETFVERRARSFNDFLGLCCIKVTNAAGWYAET